jgi:DNA-binding response OmpR family regulator
MKTTVLVIDDDPNLLKLMADSFGRHGFDVYPAKDGYVGAKLFNSMHFDLVVTDILMPNKEGIETIIELKRGANPPKIIAISGGGQRNGCDFLEWAKMLGADEVLMKPFTMSGLVALANRILLQSVPAPPEASPLVRSLRAHTARLSR